MLIFHHPSYTDINNYFGIFVNHIFFHEFYFTIQNFKHATSIYKSSQHSLHNLEYYSTAYFIMIQLL